MKSNQIFFLGVVGIVVLIMFYAFSGEQLTHTYVDEIEEYRKDKDVMFKTGAASPLDRHSKELFDSLSYFDVNQAYKVEAELTKYAVPELVNVGTNNGKKRRFTKYGIAKFQMNGREHSLLLLRSMDRRAKDILFLPFTDATNGFETYETGRYLDLEIPKTDKIILDFNMAYNPYCAYNVTYECPVPPKENMLEIEILAGEKKFFKRD
ncbi:DUF1684 domain-containing protein [Flammeovirgaceae bacterium SG7u.111]|nr:DUF1684 domain-containing protein [Flammeovirgaceae bacterium SG7u.132]WPO38282.1 DUF1684 domain-containing protein [Flammeovirgaceae bacterium SG7u.111]